MIGETSCIVLPLQLSKKYLLLILSLLFLLEARRLVSRYSILQAVCFLRGTDLEKLVVAS